jgi:6-phosphogluconolactonase
MVVRGRIQHEAVPKILVRKDVKGLSAAAAGRFVEFATGAIGSRGSFSVALAGGNTPRALYRLLASKAYRTAIDWTKAAVFVGDERNVPPDSPESNFRMVSEELLRPLSIDETNSFRWQTELADPATVAARYEEKLRAKTPLDLVLLGLGSDAHTASLFPHTNALHETEKLAVANWVEKLNDYRFTMTFPAINSAANVMILVAGAEKAEAVANVLEGEFLPDEYPAQLVKPDGGDLYWLLDEAAASSLEGP